MRSSARRRRAGSRWRGRGATPMSPPSRRSPRCARSIATWPSAGARRASRRARRRWSPAAGRRRASPPRSPILELWLGACTLLDGKAADAHETFALARALAPRARPDCIFPPEVQAAFAHAAPGAAVTPRLELSPPGARLWIDGQPAAGASTTAGLHWIVVERADRKPVGRVVRITQAAPEVAVSLAEPAPPAEALGQAAARAAEGPLGSDEGLGVSAALGRVVWVVGAHAADCFAAADAAHPVRHVDFATDPIDAVCGVEPACVAPPAPKRPLYKRAALWVPVGVAVAVAVVAGVVGGTLANASSDYVVRVR